MAEVFGLTATGFNAKSQQQIISEIQASLQAVFGQNINFAASSNFSQLVNIFAEREALLWQLIQAVYASQYPGGAEGTSVDNILALTNMRRIAALPTRTQPTPLTQVNGITLYGLRLLGVAGTVLNSGNIVQTNASPPLQFKLDATVTIQPAVNAQQNIFLSNIPDTGNFNLSIVAPSGNTLTTPTIPFNATPQTTLLKGTSNPTAGHFKLQLSIAGSVATTAFINFNANALAIQNAIQFLTGYSAVTVSGTDFATGFTIAWNGLPNPLTVVTGSTLDVTPSTVDSIQSAINTLFDTDNANYPFTDVTVITGASGYIVTFGNGSVFGSQPVSSAQPWPLFLNPINTLQQGSNVTNIKIVNQAQGAPAQAIATATCTSDGPNFVKAGSLNTIGTAVSGLNSVINDLDCITGSDIENDTEALVRREENLQSNANGPLASIVEKVKALPNVTAIVGFENDNEAALQVVEFATPPLSGQYKLVLLGQPSPFINYNDTSSQIQTKLRTLAGFSTVLVTGNSDAGFTIDFNGSFGGQPMPLINVSTDSTGAGTFVVFGRPGKSFEIVVEGGDDTSIAQTILSSKPAGIKAFGSTTVQVFDDFGNAYNISFSRPTEVPIYVTIVLQTDLGSLSPKFNPQSISTIQEDIVNIGNGVGIGGLIIGFGTNGLIGAFNSVPGIVSYTMSFGRSPNPTQNVNIQLQPEEAPAFETFLVAVSYT